MFVNFKQELKLLFEDLGYDLKYYSTKLGVSENILDNYLQGIKEPAEIEQSRLRDKLNMLESNQKENYLFLGRNKYIKEYENYRINKPGKDYPVVKKDHPVFKFIHNELPKNIKKLINKKYSERIIDINGKTGEGRLGNCYYISFLDNKYTNSSRYGVYVVLLFSETGTEFYTSIGFGTESLSLNQVESLAANLNSNLDLTNLKNSNLITNNNITLGSSDRALKWQKSVLLSIKRDIREVNADELINDIYLICDFFYKNADMLNDLYSSSVLEGVKENVGDLSKRNDTIIRREAFEKIREYQEKRNKEIGDLAEEYVFNIETNRLLNINPNLRVEWKSKTHDGHGYDIESYFSANHKKYIEVKGTSADTNNVTFYLSKNEKEKAEKYGNDYVLILVSNVGKGKSPRIVAEIRNPAKVFFHKMIPINYKYCAQQGVDY